MKKLGYKAAPTNENKGYVTHGGFKSQGKPGSGQKAGKHNAEMSGGSHKGYMKAKEVKHDIHPKTFVSQAVDTLRKQGRHQLTAPKKAGYFA